MDFKKLSRYGFLLVVAGIIIILDQLSKAWVRDHLQLDEWWTPLSGLPFVRILHVSNTGVAFGMFQGQGIVFTILAILVSLAIIYYFPRVSPADWPLRLAMGMQLGGAVGNLIDRVTLGHVVDFISVGNFPVFNIADSSITVGVAVLLLGVWWQERRQKKEAGSAPALARDASETPTREHE